MLVCNLKFLENSIFFVKKFKKTSKIWFLGPFGVTFFAASNKAFCYLNTFFFFSSTIFLKSGAIALRGGFLNGLKPIFLEFFIVGKGFRFKKIKEAKSPQIRGIFLFLGFRRVSYFIFKKNVKLVGINKKKIVLFSKNSQVLLNTLQQVQKKKLPSGFYIQGLFFRYKVRKFRNFRHKKLR